MRACTSGWQNPFRLAPAGRIPNRLLLPDPAFLAEATGKGSDRPGADPARRACSRRDRNTPDLDRGGPAWNRVRAKLLARGLRHSLRAAAHAVRAECCDP